MSPNSEEHGVNLHLSFPTSLEFSYTHGFVLTSSILQLEEMEISEKNEKHCVANICPDAGQTGIQSSIIQFSLDECLS